MKYKHHLVAISSFFMLLFLLSACGGAVSQAVPQQTVTVNKSFQAQLSPIATVPTYRCGAWSSNNAPGTYSTIAIYAKLTSDVAGVSGATAQAVVHFKYSDAVLDAQPISNSGGYVSFSLPLQGRQPARVPATVDVTFKVNGASVQCTEAFFTPL
ncbi:MAG: hypothetical protein JO125_02390 [Chloroflexi bacterium]|nr:hypothetical protein [Ktedonobacteraceae bacterium]MBV9706243.1 hypothetical protein [Chloroflexota bacterium]